MTSPAIHPGSLLTIDALPIPEVAGILSLTALLENDYVGHRYDLAYIALTPIKAYDLTNFRVGFAMPRWSAFLFANNLFNEKAYLAYQGQIGAYVPTFNRVTTNQPLTIGIDVSYKFR